MATNSLWKVPTTVVHKGVQYYVHFYFLSIILYSLYIPFTGKTTKYFTPLDNQAIRKIKKKHRCWTRYIETRESHHYTNYCRLRSQVKQITKKARIDHERKIASEAKTMDSGLLLSGKSTPSWPSTMPFTPAFTSAFYQLTFFTPEQPPFSPTLPWTTIFTFK